MGRRALLEGATPFVGNLITASEDVLNMVIFSVYCIVSLYVTYPPPSASGFAYRDAIELGHLTASETE